MVAGRGSIQDGGATTVPPAQFIARDRDALGNASERHIMQARLDGHGVKNIRFHDLLMCVAEGEIGF